MVKAQVLQRHKKPIMGLSLQAVSERIRGAKASIPWSAFCLPASGIYKSETKNVFMKNIKIIVATFIVTGILTIAGSVFAGFLIGVPSTADGKNTQGTIFVPPQPITKSGCLSVSEQIAKGYKYDSCTGEKLPASFSPDQVEARFQAIEARLNKLEAKR
ncbi:MAG: hypothetical protein V4665_04270 [Patescibacteria group bacterium]